MKLKFVITVVIEVSLEEYPGAKTIEDVVKIQQKWVDDGTFSPEDILINSYDSIIVTAIEE